MNKYNEWCHKKPLIFPSQEIADTYFDENHRILSLPISKYSKAALQQHVFLKNDGLEFIAFSNLKIDKNIKLNSGLELRLCFNPDLGGRSGDDPIQKAEYLMHRKGRYLYDGWLPIKDWKTDNISNELRKIDEFLSLFSATGHVYFSWQPKYFYKEKEVSIIYADTKKNEKSIIDTVLSFQNNLDKLNIEDDKKSILKSINWINKAKETTDTIIKFLFYVLAIEQLAKYVENSKSTSSFYKIRTHKDKKERREWKLNCIKEKLENIDYDNKPWSTIDDIYFSCNTGLKEMIKRQVKNAFKSDSYLQDISIDELYSVRSKIAHGNIDTLNSDEIEMLNNKIQDISSLAVNYILSVLYKCDIEFEGGQLHSSFGINFVDDDTFIGNPSMYVGPTHMALRYYNMI